MEMTAEEEMNLMMTQKKRRKKPQRRKKMRTQRVGTERTSWCDGGDLCDVRKKRRGGDKLFWTARPAQAHAGDAKGHTSYGEGPRVDVHRKVPPRVLRIRRTHVREAHL